MGVVGELLEGRRQRVVVPVERGELGLRVVVMDDARRTHDDAGRVVDADGDDGGGTVIWVIWR